ncbi:MAG: ribonuclease 3 [Candidatus Hydrogenedentota bacterium]
MLEDEQRAHDLKTIQARLGFQVQTLPLLDRALTHASTAAESDGPTYNYESLEFLGDAVLGLAVGHYLFDRQPDLTPGEYSRMRAGVVNRRCLARVAGRVGIAPFIRLGRGEELAGGRDRASLLADCMEAMIGAIYWDQGFEAAKGFVYKVFGPELDEILTAEPVWDYKSRLQHYCQAERIALPRFDVIRSEGPDHCKEFEVEVSIRGTPVGRGIGSSKKEAEQNAARVALMAEGVRVI